MSNEVQRWRRERVTVPMPEPGRFSGVVEPPEPPIGTVIRYAIDHGGKLYTYVSLRAENGLWYTTGGANQNATWAQLFAALKEQLRGPVEVLIPHSVIWRY